jgi:transcriptional regulator with XRE-family HTH domain
MKRGQSVERAEGNRVATAPQQDGGSTGGPTVLRILLGAQLRGLREARGVSREDAGWEIRASESKISRMELGRVGFKERDVADLLTLYGVADADEREALLTLAREANTPGWWHRYSDILPSWFQSYLGLEAAAALIRTYEVQFVPGLLQTRDYARAVIVLGHGSASPAELDRRVALRMTRQELLTRPEAPQLWAVVDEAALRRPIGGPEVMRAQLEALIDATKLPNVRLQVIPFHAGGHAAAGGPFSILRFPDQELPDVVYVEQLTSALYLDKREDVDHYAVAMERLSIEAEPPANTADLLERMLHEVDRTVR